MKKVSKEVVIRNRLGLHARPAAQLVQLAGRFSSQIYIRKGEAQINGKSIMGVLMLAAAQGSKLEISAEGDDAEEAVAQINNLITGEFGQE